MKYIVAFRHYPTAIYEFKHKKDRDAFIKDLPKGIVYATSEVRE